VTGFAFGADLERVEEVADELTVEAPALSVPFDLDRIELGAISVVVASNRRGTNK